MAERRLLGQPASPGLARGPVAVLETVRRQSRCPAGSVVQERTALLLALGAARAEVEALASDSFGAAADMLGFQAAMLGDDELARPALEAIAAGVPAHSAWEDAMAQEAAGYAASGETRLAARTADLDDIRDRVLAHLAPGLAGLAPGPGAVIAASDLPLSRFLAIDWSQGGGIVLTGGSPASHVAMLARARGVPMVAGLGAGAALRPGREALVDGAAGLVVLDPEPPTRQAFAVRLAGHATVRRPSARLGPALTRDGTRIALTLNIGSIGELDGLDPSCGDGIGLVRTELLLHGAAGLPGEDVQYAAYRRVIEWAAGRPVVIRALDAGGDKPMPGLTPGGEDGSFLGLRGVRLLLRQPGLLRTQLRALARAAVHGKLRVLLPMVTIPEEFDACRGLLDEAVAKLDSEGIPARRPMLGIMVEVPAAAIAIERFEAEFFSIGSNDLTQYVTACGRGIGPVASLADPLNPAVLRLIEGVCRHGRATGRDVSLCGDAAGEPRCTGPLLQAGLRSLSVAPGCLGRTREAVAAIDLRRGLP